MHLNQILLYYFYYERFTKHNSRFFKKTIKIHYKNFCGINDYLSGSPTAGTGKYYASAAWDYGVDPRWAPAISCIESTKGSACFRSYNAWGFGGRSFSSWQDGITTVVRCLGGSLYGGHLTQEAAQNYCPPTWQNWYNNVSSEMSKI